ncbi:ThiF family adenylyltransferase [Nocardioides sp. TRM66260-LWL]|uniref:ThiF family adenylyltransferase n=1 Tax=Nocardioides sp. TRM66260-LWL TaxID=2874478 RepID=UPI001CC7F264|nr:ThiF family adenylyltransferase [Nocardioides sp. TRM66260-LWL]MBZ5735345.1 ThiF family adenylyltransferase [Nocardioides sp. TRM66260-LWL]
MTRQAGGLGLMVHYPLPAGAGARRGVDEEALPCGEGRALRLRVRFPQTFPGFPPEVHDVDGGLAGLRHRSPLTGELCLVHAEDWHADTTLADLLTSQMPRILASHAVGEGVLPPEGLEVPVPESALDFLRRRPPVIVTDAPIPAGVDDGVLLGRFIATERRIGAGVIEAIYGPGFEVRTDLPAAQVERFKVSVLGRWLRDPDYTPGERPSVTWRRIAGRLRPLETDIDAATPDVAPDAVIDPAEGEVIGLLVPDEVAYRRAGESWVFLGRVKVNSSWGTRWRVIALGTQYLSRTLLAERTPVARQLAERSVVVVGLGSVGLPIAVDLAQSGVGRMMLIDRDIVDLATMTRQSGGSLTAAGVSKAGLAQVLIEDSAPYCEVRAVNVSVEHLWERFDDPVAAGVARQLRRALREADMVIDATANPCVTRLLDRVRSQAGKPLVVASGTAGGWGGVVTLLDGTGACWACIELHRTDGALPVPPASPDGWVTPRGCGALTFTGARHQMQQISLHASAVTIAHLTRQPMAGDYFVATMRTPDDEPTPIAWGSTPLTVHPVCLHHGTRDQQVPCAGEREAPR